VDVYHAFGSTDSCIAVPIQQDTRGKRFGEVEAETEAKAGQRETFRRQKKN
jgi:hypothetical protein